MTTRPLGNNCLIEVIRDYADISRADDAEGLSSGKLISFSASPYHFTASAAMYLPDSEIVKMSRRLQVLVGKTVRWEQFAEGGQTFTEDGKTYALVPWWRLISYED